MRPITLINPYYLNAGMLREQMRVWSSLPESIRQHLHVIVIDDGSPSDPASSVWRRDLPLASSDLYLVLVDVRWNWLFCRNLGVAKATTDWVVMTDIDHVVPPETWRALMTDTFDPQCVYRFSREDAPLRTPYKPHPNSWFLSRAMFDRIGGYDERFSGFYGTDAEFRERVHQRAKAVVMLPHVLVRYPREVIADASTTTYGRKEWQDKVNVGRIRDARAAQGAWHPLRLTFPYEQVV